MPSVIVQDLTGGVYKTKKARYHNAPFSFAIHNGNKLHGTNIQNFLKKSKKI